MSLQVNLQALPTGVFEEVLTPENVRRRTSVNSLTQLSFPKSRSALWDSSPAGEKLRLQLCSHRKPRLVLLEKALRLAQRHARHSNKARLHCFFLGSVSVDSDEEGVTVTLDRFDPGRDQASVWGRVPSALLPGDVLVPCLFSTQNEMSSDAVVLSETELHHCFKELQQFSSSRQTLDLSQLLKVKGYIFCSQQADATAFHLSWSVVCPSVAVDIQPVRPIPIIPTALLRSLTSVGRPSPHAAGRQRGFLTMDQTRKLLLLLESDPKASTLPLVGLWLSGVTHIYNPQVWVWCLRFMFSSGLQDRVLSESGSFLLVLFSLTHRAPQFFQCRGSRPGPGSGLQLDCQLLTASQSITLYQVAPLDARTLQCELGSEGPSRQMEVFREAQRSFNSSSTAAARLSVSDQDSGVEDEDLSPRPSPSPHPPAQQARRVQPSVPELSLLIDSSFTSNHTAEQDSGSTPRPPLADRKSTPTPPTKTSCVSSSAPKPPPPPPPHLHSTPNSNLQQPCTCCSSNTYNCTAIFSSPGLPPAAAALLPPASSHHHTPPPPPSTALSSLPPAPPSTNHHPAPPLFSSHNHTPRPLSSHHSIPPASLHLAPSSSSNHHPAPPPPSSHDHVPRPPPSHRSPPPSSLHPASPSSLQHHTLPRYSNCPTTPSVPRVSTCQPSNSSFSHPAPPPSHYHTSPPPSLSSSTPLSTHPHTRLAPPPSTLVNPLAPSCPCSHPSPPLPWCGNSPSPHPSHPPAVADPASPLWLNQCNDRKGGVVPLDAYQLLHHQDRQLRLLQAQVQMLLEAQWKLQSSSRPVDTQTSRSTASIAVGTGASLFWGDQDVPAPPSSPPPPPPPPAPLLSSPKISQSSSSSLSTSSHDLSSVHRPGDGDVTSQVARCLPSPEDSFSGLQSPVLGESVSMYTPADEQQSFYHNLMIQLTSRLQESDSKQEEEEESGQRRRSLSGVSDHSQSSHSSSSSSRRKQQNPAGDPVVSATLRQLQQLGVDMDKEDLSESDRNRLKAVESASTLASINPVAVLSRLSVSEPTASTLFPGGSVNLSLEANAIALRYLSDSQLSRLSLGSLVPAPSSSSDSLLLPTNMSLATRKYMRRYGLIEEDGEEEEEEEEEQEVASVRPPLTDTRNVKLLPQSQLIRDLQPKMQLIADSDKENCSSRRPSLVKASSRQTEGSMGNILDLSRLRQLPKLF